MSHKEEITDDEDIEEEKTLEDKLVNIVEFLTADSSSSFVICVRDIYQTQKYLTQTHWRLNMRNYVYDFLKSNISLDILNRIKTFDTLNKDFMTDLINDYLIMKKRQETPETFLTEYTNTYSDVAPDEIFSYLNASEFVLNTFEFDKYHGSRLRNY